MGDAKLLQLPSSTSSFHGLLSELERPELHIASEKTIKNKQHLERANGRMFDTCCLNGSLCVLVNASLGALVSAVLMENLTWTQTVVDCTRAFYPYHNHFARSVKVYYMQQTCANMSKDCNKYVYNILYVTYCTYRYRYCGTLDYAGILIFCGSQTFYDHRSLLARPFVSFKLLILGVFVGDDCYIGVFMDVICDLFLHSAQDERRNWFGTLRPIHGEVGGLMVSESM